MNKFIYASLAFFASYLPAQAQYVNLTGRLNINTVAIGGETTGYTLRAQNGTTYELALTPQQKLTVTNWNNRNVRVAGFLNYQRGVEIRYRAIIRVTTIALATFGGPGPRPPWGYPYPYQPPWAQPPWYSPWHWYYPWNYYH